MISAKTWIFAACFGLFVWAIGVQVGPVIAAALVAVVGVANARHTETKMEDLEKRMKDLSWRLRHVMKDEA